MIIFVCLTIKEILMREKDNKGEMKMTGSQTVKHTLLRMYLSMLHKRHLLLQYRQKD